MTMLASFPKTFTELNFNENVVTNLCLFIDSLPYSVRILLESAIRNCDEFNVLSSDVEKILEWVKNAPKDVEIPFKPARVILQDFT